MTRDQYTAAQRAVVDTLSRAGVSHQIRYRGGFFLPGRARAICVFDADSAAVVTAVNEQAGVPFTQVVEAVDLRLG